MKIFEFSDAQRARFGFSHRIELTYADFTTAGASQAIALLPYVAGQCFTNAAFKLVTASVGPSVTGLAMIVGWNGATTDDDNGLIESVELCAAGTEILFGAGVGAAFATTKAGYCPLDAGNIEATFTATGANVNVHTAFEIHIFLNRVNLSSATSG